MGLYFLLTSIHLLIFKENLTDTMTSVFNALLIYLCSEEEFMPELHLLS